MRPQCPGNKHQCLAVTSPTSLANASVNNIFINSERLTRTVLGLDESKPPNSCQVFVAALQGVQVSTILQGSRQRNAPLPDPPELQLAKTCRHFLKGGSCRHDLLSHVGERRLQA
jgi:hypothetical protein